MSQTPTLMGLLDELAVEVASDPDPHMSGEALHGLLQVSQADLLEFQDANKQAGRAMARLLGSSEVALDGMIQTVLTIGYKLRMAHEEADRIANAGQNMTAPDD